ncbi:MAG: sulfotransferase [Candidatus Neomarinimicrobiota bacterium]
MATLPNFLVVGAAKSGTTSLYHYVNQHPDIYMSPVKEPEYFSFMGQEVHFIGPGGQSMNFGIINDAEAYAALFEDLSGEKAIGECSTSYLFLPQAAANIHHAIPHCRIIMILRHPVERTFSHYLDHVRALCEDLPFEDAIAAEQTRADNGWRWGYQYTGHSRYYAQVKRYYDRFPAENVRIYLFDRLQQDPHGLMADVYRFLNVDDTFRPNVSKVYNPSGLPRRIWLQKLLVKPNPLKTLIRPLLPRHWRRRIIQSLTRANLIRTTMEPEARQRLTELLREDTLALQDLIGQDLSNWLV